MGHHTFDEENVVPDEVVESKAFGADPKTSSGTTLFNENVWFPTRFLNPYFLERPPKPCQEAHFLMKKCGSRRGFLGIAFRAGLETSSGTILCDEKVWFPTRFLNP